MACLRLIAALAILTCLLQPAWGQSPVEAPKEISQRWGWTAFGQVLDPDGKPIPDVEVRVATGSHTLLGGGSTTTARDGGYRLRFGEGIWSPGPINSQVAWFRVSKTGYVELERTSPVNMMARIRPTKFKEHYEQIGWDWDEVVIRGKPFRLDFTMAPVATLKVTLEDEQGWPLKFRYLELSREKPGGSDHRFEKQWELLPNIDWWFTYSNEKLRIPKTRTQSFRLPTTGEYTMKLRVVPHPDSGTHVLVIQAVTNSKGVDVTEEVIGDGK